MKITFKINVDASVFEAEEHFGLGWVARKMKAELVAARTDAEGEKWPGTR